MAAAGGRTERTYTTVDWTDFVHTGPGTLAGRYMRSFWQPVYRSEELPPGRARPIKVMSEDFTLYRGEGGAPHLVAFRCAHRGTQLSTGWVEGNALRCFYHGWKYDATGQCIEQPAEPDPFCQKIRIQSCPVQEYLGLIFAYLGEREAPPLPRYLDFEQPGVLETSHTYTRACNYFQDLENDPAHGAFVHRKGVAPRPIPTGFTAEETEWGIAVSSKFPDSSVRVSQIGMPNVNHHTSPPQSSEMGLIDTLTWTVPIDDEAYTSFQVRLVHVMGEAARRYEDRRDQWFAKGGRVYSPELSEAVLRGELRIVDVQTSRPDVNSTRVEDDVAQVGQGRLVDRSQEHLGRSDVHVILLRHIWARELRAFAEGRPLKQWTRPKRLIASGPGSGIDDRLALFRHELLSAPVK